MSNLSLEDLTKEAQDVFESHPDINKVFATADGNIFLPTSENAALNHAKQEKLTLHTISRTTEASEDTDTDEA